MMSYDSSRSAKYFVDELEYLLRAHGVNVTMIPDENPMLARVRWEKILDTLIQRSPGIDLLMETRGADILLVKSPITCGILTENELKFTHHICNSL